MPRPHGELRGSAPLTNLGPSCKPGSRSEPVQLAVNIVVLAAIYALIACGYVLIYRVSRVLNLAHGELMMLGAYLLLTTASLFAAIRLVAIAGGRGAEPAGRRAGLRVPHAQDDRRDGAGRRAHHCRARHPAARRHRAGLVGAAAVSGAAARHRQLRHRVAGRRAHLALRGAAGAHDSVRLRRPAAFLRFGRWGVRMRAAGQNPLLAAQRGINLHAIYALAWGLSTLTGALAGMLIALDSGLGQTMAIIGLKAFPAALVGGLDSLVGRAGRLADRRRRRGAADPLRRSAAVRGRAVPGADRHAGGAALGPVRHARGARPCLGGRAPAAISAPATRQDLGAARDARRATCRCRRCSWLLLAFPFFASPFLLDLANQVFLA